MRANPSKLLKGLSLEQINLEDGGCLVEVEDGHVEAELSISKEVKQVLEVPNVGVP